MSHAATFRSFLSRHTWGVPLAVCVTRVRRPPTSRAGVAAGVLTLLAAASSASAQFGGPRPPTQPPRAAVTVYEGRAYSGRSAPLTSSWSGGGPWDRRIRSVRVPSGYRVTLYVEPNYGGAQTTLTSDWSPSSPTAYWAGRARSLRIDRAAVDPPVAPVPPVAPAPPTPPAGSVGTVPTGYTEAGFRGRVLGVTRDWPGDPSGYSRYARLRSLRVPSGWRVVGYARPNYRGPSVARTSDWVGGPVPVRSLRVYPPAPVRQPR